MTQTLAATTIALLLGLAIGSLFVGRGVAQGPPASQGNAQSLTSHHKELKFTLNANETKLISMPKADAPVRVDVSTDAVNLGHGLDVPPDPFFEAQPIAFSLIAALDSATG